MRERRCAGAVVLVGGIAAMATAGSDHVAGWSFDEGSGSLAWDDAGDTFGLLDGPTWVEGIAGTALHFDGLDDLVELADGDGLPDALVSLESGSVAMWMRFDTLPDAGVLHSMMYLGRDWEDSDHSSFQIELGHSQVNSKLYWTITEVGEQQPTLCYDSTINLVTDVWYHYVLVVDETGNTGYLNGEVMGNRHYNFGSPDHRKFFGDIQIQTIMHLGHGLFAGSDQWMGGTLDEVRIWDRALSAVEVQEYFDSFGYDPPDPPEEDGVTIESPEDGDVVAGDVSISGSSVGLEGGHIRVRIGDQPPVDVTGIENWTFDWNTVDFPDGDTSIRVVGRACQSCPSFSDEIMVEVDNIPPAIVFGSVDDGDVVWGDVSISGSTTQSGSVTVSVDGGEPIPAGGGDPWSVDLDMTAAGAGAHVLSAELRDNGTLIDAAEVTLIASSASPPVPSCGDVEFGDRLPYSNAASPDWVNTCGDVCWPVVTFHIIGHSESLGLASHLADVFTEAPIDFREFVFVEHAIAGEETWEWITPGSDGEAAIQSILAEADGVDAPPHIALVLTSNNVTWPAGDPDMSDPNYAKYVADVQALIEMLDDDGRGVIMTYLTAHRMKPSNLMPAWYENLAIGDVIAEAEAAGFSRLKSGPDLHAPSWCAFPGGYASDLSHPDTDGLRQMAEAWHPILTGDIKHPGDVNGDGAVSTTDLLAILSAWGDCGECVEDVTGDGFVGTDDILLILSYWT